MLGRGLSSLIPPQKNQQNQPANGNQGANVQPVAPVQPLQNAAPIQNVPNSVSDPQPQVSAPLGTNAPDANPVPSTPIMDPARELESDPQHDFETPAVLPVAGGQLKISSYIPSEKDKGMKPQEFVFHIEVDKIDPNPHQPRKVFDEAAIKELASSIREFGILQPIVVTKIEKEVPTGTEVRYELISGERRLLASKMLGLDRIPAIIRNVGLERERLELAMIENIQRENLNPIELGRALTRLQEEFRLTQREIAVRMGKSRESIANTMRLLDLPMEIQDALGEGKISESHGRLLLTIDDPGLQRKLFEDLLSSKLTTRELKEKVEEAKPTKQGRLHHELAPELRMLQERLTSELGAPVQIQQTGPHSQGGKIMITYYSLEELQGIMDKLGKKEEI